MHHQPTNSKIPQPQRTHTAPGIMQSDNCRAELFMIQRIFLACFFMGDVPPNAEFRQLGGPNYIVSHKKTSHFVFEYNSAIFEQLFCDFCTSGNRNECSSVYLPVLSGLMMV